jgi:hypothetical protein
MYFKFFFFACLIPWIQTRLCSKKSHYCTTYIFIRNPFSFSWDVNFFMCCGLACEEMVEHRLNMELDLQSLFGLHEHSCTQWQRPRNPPSPSARALGLIYEGAIGQPRLTTSPGDPSPVWATAQLPSYPKGPMYFVSVVFTPSPPAPTRQ